MYMVMFDDDIKQSHLSEPPDQLESNISYQSFASKNAVSSKLESSGYQSPMLMSIKDFLDGSLFWDDLDQRYPLAEHHKLAPLVRPLRKSVFTSICIVGKDLCAAVGNRKFLNCSNASNCLVLLPSFLYLPYTTFAFIHHLAKVYRLVPRRLVCRTDEVHLHCFDICRLSIAPYVLRLDFHERCSIRIDKIKLLKRCFRCLNIVVVLSNDREQYLCLGGLEVRVVIHLTPSVLWNEEWKDTFFKQTISCRLWCEGLKDCDQGHHFFDFIKH
ncbi:hypothetical protein Tco_1093524 [Tanacetum coccineum]|uniref:Uncharacterized protein n=1 Tax=Tanacetum coccineum TaxID=301880 RepID=A0ABQ5IE43_9ASTR